MNNDFELASTSGEEDQSNEDSLENLRARLTSRNSESIATPQYSPAPVDLTAYILQDEFHQSSQPEYASPAPHLSTTQQNLSLESRAVSLAAHNLFYDDQSDEDEPVLGGALLMASAVDSSNISARDNIPLMVMGRSDYKAKGEVDDESSSISVERGDVSSDEEPQPNNSAQRIITDQLPVESTNLGMLEVRALQPVDNVPHNSDFIDEAYTTISTLIPEYAELTRRDMIVLAVASISGAGASIYNYKFATQFLGLVAKDLNWSEAFTDFARTLSGAGNISVNVPIYTRSIIAFEGKYREDIAGRLKTDRINLSNDKKVMRNLYFYMFVALAASAANLIFASEGFSSANLFSLVNLWVIGAVVFQFLTAPPLNFQSIINLVELDPLRHENVQKRKFTFLKMLRDGMTPDVAIQLPDNILEDMSKGQLTKPTGLPLPARKLIGLIYAASSAPYGAAFGYSVYYRASKSWLTVHSRDALLSYLRSFTTVPLPRFTEVFSYLPHIIPASASRVTEVFSYLTSLTPASRSRVTEALSYLPSIIPATLQKVTEVFSYFPSIIPATYQRVSQVFSFLPSLVPTNLQNLPRVNVSTAMNLARNMTTTPHVEIALTVKDVTLGITISVLTVLGGGLKFLLLAYFNYMLMQSVLSGRDETLFRYQGYSIEVSALRGSPSTITKLIMLLGFCAFVVFLSIGSASEVPEKYFWHDTGGATLLYSALIGSFAAFALNLRSFKYAIDAGVDRAKSAWWLKWLFPNHDRLARFGNDDNQFRLRAMYNLAQMSDTSFDSRFQSAFSTNSEQLLDDETGLRDVGLTLETADLVHDMRERDIHAEGHAPSASAREFVRALTHLRDHGDPRFFASWKQKYGKDSGTRTPATAPAEEPRDTTISLLNESNDAEQVPSALQPRREMLASINEAQPDLLEEEFYADDLEELGSRL